MNKRLLRCGLFVTLLLGSVESQAQTGTAGRWESTFATLRHNRRIKTTKRDVGPVTGRFIGLSGDTVLVRTGGATVRMGLASIDSVWIEDTHWKIGAIVAGAVTAVLGAELASALDGNPEAGAVVGAVPGIVTGGLIGGLFPRWRVLRPRGRLSSLSPPWDNSPAPEPPSHARRDLPGPPARP